MKPTILVIHGPMGSGKSTICTALMKTLHDFYFVDRAAIKNGMLKNLDDRSLASTLSKRAVYVITDGLVLAKKNILIQEFHAFQLRKKYPRKRVIGIYLECSVEISKQRDVSRSGKSRAEIVERMHAEHGRPDKGDVVINTELNSVRTVVKRILAEL